MTTLFDGLDRSREAQFWAFHQAHPEVYREFCRRVAELRGKGIHHYGAKAIFEVMRYHSAVDGRDAEPFKLNNNYPAFYARVWQSNHPEAASFFYTRVQKSRRAA